MLKKQYYTSNDLHEQTRRLMNEIEELRLEREESKKNVLHFIREADLIRQELERAQALIQQLTFYKNRYDDKQFMLFSKLSQLGDTKIKQLFDLLEDNNNEKKKNNDFLAREEMTLSSNSNNRVALKKKRESLKTITKNICCYCKKEFKKDTSLLSPPPPPPPPQQQQQQQQGNVTHHLTIEELCTFNHSESLSATKPDEQHKLIKKEDWQHDNKIKMQQNRKLDLLEQAKDRENNLKTINKMLREEIRKLNKTRVDTTINVEYLRNVIIKFLERQNTRAQLVPILSTLLKCSTEDQTRLSRLVRNKLTSY
ncbi:uncharacterized protein BX663DRAFT_515474 [Cokeromyces recurvatus]|uniref:uncharacterized protein n=1 Tax=Cokeromyces recurvatus TaxID=90255 RepID=UPI00221F03AB|nr:uncharacterized protein BX663DRAFT_515474 [Cokeromyces recurvatus]KAI7901273.1 hypothetical protein BX663DRAFT_515474 [Cokeromyces recurvatus]